MQIPTWTQPAISGAVVGAAALAIIGFGWGGWVTGGNAKEMAQDAASTATVAAMTPYCVARSKSDPNSAKVFAALKAADDYDRSDIIAKAGWATPLGAKSPNDALATACTTALKLD
jgi:alpha/beta superfamily hydrolase